MNGKAVWEHLKHEKYDLLTPNLPNVFLAVVHQDQAVDLGRLIEKTIREEWQTIATHVWDYLEKQGMIPAEEAGLTAAARKQRFDSQVARFLSISWQATPWPKDLGQAMALAESFAEQMPIQKARATIKTIIDYVTETMPKGDRDSRYYEDKDTRTKLNNIGLGWSVILAYNSWQLDAVRQTRAFSAWASGGWDSGTFCNKDSLGGKAEAVAGGEQWKTRAAEKSALKSLFKHADWLGASTLIKRVWHLAYLKEKWGLPTDPTEFRMPNTHGIARGEPFSSDESEDEEKLPGEKYYAVLALDGDKIGEWVSGGKTPQLEHQFSDYKGSSEVQRHGARVYFENQQGQNLLKTHRPLSPSYHLQFSEALSNFALKCARRIVEAHNGRLIYSGGDDVLAMLPADTALKCAQDLREAFQGNAVTNAKIVSPTPGYLSISKDQTGHPISFVVPGPAAEVSVGIAIAHFKSPLQDVVRAAQKAEKRAKSSLGRAAVAITVMKRSGEITEWGTKWKTGGLELYHAIASALEEKTVSAKFPHRICQLLEPYCHSSMSQLADVMEFDADAVIAKEFDFAIARQSAAGQASINSQKLIALLQSYLHGLSTAHREKEEPRPSEISAQERLQAMIGLCTTVAFAHRTRNETADRQPA